MLPDGDLILSRGGSIVFTKMGVFGAVVIGLIVGALMSMITEYYTSMGKRPVNSIIKQSSTGHATTSSGLSVGMESTVAPILVWLPVFILPFCSWIIWSGNCCCWYDGNDSHAVGD